MKTTKPKNSFVTRGLVAVALALMLQPAPGQAQSGGTQQSIKVHGHWTIEVRNPDGTVAETREFENALSVGGSDALSNLLARRRAPGTWVVLFGACNKDGGGTAPCALAEANVVGTVANGWRIGDLAVDVPTSGPNAQKLVLTGSGTVNKAGPIGQVATALALCAPTVACTFEVSTFSGFTQALLATPVNVMQGQIVQITVVISFS